MSQESQESRVQAKPLMLESNVLEPQCPHRAHYTFVTNILDSLDLVKNLTE